MTKRILGLLMVFVMVGAFVPSASATAISYKFETVAGATVIDGSSSYPVAASAQFVFNDNLLTLTLTNETPNVFKTPQELVGFSWNLPAGASATLLSAAPSDVVLLCDASKNNCSSPDLGPTYGWAATGSTFIRAGSGAFHPYEIISDPWGPVVNGGLNNGPHNPFLVGPVDFNFLWSGTPVLPTDVVFYWGTAGYQTDGTCTENCSTTQVPEPASMLLFGSGLLGAGFFARKRRTGK